MGKSKTEPARATLRSGPHEIRMMRLRDLKPADYNPRSIEPEAFAGLSASIQRFGMVQPIVWNKRTKVIVGGHQRLQALLTAGHEESPVVVVDLDPSDERALNITLNNPNVAGDFTDGLQDLLKELESSMPKDTFESLRLDELFALRLDPEDVSEPPVPETPVKAVTKPGDLILMGPHRLLCGNSTVADDVTRALGRDRPRMIFTDPPWNVAIGKDSNPRHRQREGLENDDLGENFTDFLHGWSAACLPLLDGDLYCVMGCGEWPTIDKALRDAGMHWSATIVWVKDSFVLGRSQYHRRFEPLWYGWHEGGKSSFCGLRDVDDVWEVPRPKVSEDHPTMKPVALVARAVNNSSKRGDLVFDPFAGAGSTLMACEQLGRRFAGIEISPRFCDVIRKRWEDATGKKATIETR